MAQFSTPKLPNRKKIAFRTGKAIAKSPRGRAITIATGKAIAKSPTGRRATLQVVKWRGRKYVRPLAITIGAFALLTAILVGGLSKSRKPQDAVVVPDADAANSNGAAE